MPNHCGRLDLQPHDLTRIRVEERRSYCMAVWRRLRPIFDIRRWVFPEIDSADDWDWPEDVSEFPILASTVVHSHHTVHLDPFDRGLRIRLGADRRGTGQVPPQLESAYTRHLVCLERRCDSARSVVCPRLCPRHDRVRRVSKEFVFTAGRLSLQP